MKKINLAAAVATLSTTVLLVTGCGSTLETTPTPPEAPAEMAAEETEAPEEAETVTDEEAAYESMVNEFGTPASISDPEAEVTVKYLGRATATETSTSGAVEVIEFSVAVTNTGSTPIEGYDVMFNGVYAGDSGEPFEEVYDIDNGWSGPEYSTIMPGRTQTVKTAFEAPEPGLVQFMMGIGWSDTVVFEGELTD